MVHQHHTRAAIAVTLALTAILAPAASADPAPLARAEAAIATTHGSALVRPNPDNQTAPQTPVQSGAKLPHDPRPRSVAVTGLYGSTAPTGVRVVAHSAGFHWADAGIGAGASLVLVAVGLAGLRATTNGRKRETRQHRAVATN